MGRFGPVEGIILLLMQFTAIWLVFRVNGLGWKAAILPTLASFFATFVIHIIVLRLLAGQSQMLVRRPVLALVWFMVSMLVIWPFVRSRPGLAWRCGLFCSIAYLLFAFTFDIIRPA